MRQSANGKPASPSSRRALSSLLPSHSAVSPTTRARMNLARHKAVNASLSPRCMIGFMVCLVCIVTFRIVALNASFGKVALRARLHLEHMDTPVFNLTVNEVAFKAQYQEDAAVPLNGDIAEGNENNQESNVETTEAPQTSDQRAQQEEATKPTESPAAAVAAETQQPQLLEAEEESEDEKYWSMIADMTLEDTVVGPMDTSVSHEKGIVMCLFDPLIPMGLALIKELRCLGNRELVQVYHCLPDEISPENRQLLLDLDSRVQLVDVCTQLVKKDVLSMEMARTFRNWWLKPLAVHHSDINHVMLIDADAILLRDPAIVRETAGYQRTGTMFFYDRVVNDDLYYNKDIHTKNNQTYHYLHRWLEVFDYGRFNVSGYAPSEHMLNSYSWKHKTCHEQDSSMVFMDKSRAGKALDLLWYMIIEKRFRYTFSWGDKESFWFAYELSHTDYTFSPWGVSVVSSSTSQDMQLHPDTLCGNMAHFVPSESEEPELMYVNGKALLDPFPVSVEELPAARVNTLFNTNPTHISPRQRRREVVSDIKPPKGAESWALECLVGLGSEPLPKQFRGILLRRRLFYFAVATGMTSPLASCDLYDG